MAPMSRLLGMRSTPVLTRFAAIQIDTADRKHSMDYLAHALTALLTSSVVGGIVAVAVKQYIEKQIDSYFAKREKEFEQRIKHAGQLLDKQMAIYPEIIEFTYRVRKSIERALEDKEAVKWDGTFRPLAERFIESIFGTRAYLEDSLWLQLHVFADIVRDAVAVHDMAPDGADYATKVRSLRRRLGKLNESFEQIEAMAKAKMGVG